MEAIPNFVRDFALFMRRWLIKWISNFLKWYDKVGGLAPQNFALLVPLTLYVVGACFVLLIGIILLFVGLYAWQWEWWEILIWILLSIFWGSLLIAGFGGLFYLFLFLYQLNEFFENFFAVTKGMIYASSRFKESVDNLQPEIARLPFLFRWITQKLFTPMLLQAHHFSETEKLDVYRAKVVKMISKTSRMVRIAWIAWLAMMFLYFMFFYVFLMLFC